MRVQVWRERECARGHRDDFQGEHTHLRCIGVLLLWRRMYPQLRGTVVHMGSPRCLSVGFVCMELVRPPQLVLDHGTQALAHGDQGKVHAWRAHWGCRDRLHACPSVGLTITTTAHGYVCGAHRL